MTILLKLIYAGAITALLILLIAFGIRTFYGPPDEPEFPRTPVSFRGPGVEQPPPAPELQQFEAEQRRYQEAYDRYLDERADYRSRVFVAACVLGIAAVAAGLALPTRLDAIRLGLVSGGVGTILYAVIQAGGDLDRTGATVVFLVATVGLLLVMVSGYRWLAAREE